MLDAIIVGAGPCGLSTAISLQQAGFQTKIIEKGFIVNSVYHYPLSMTFFSTPDKIEIGGVPLISTGDRPTRHEALKYYRKIVDHFQLDVHTREKVVDIKRLEEGFQVVTENRYGKQVYGAKNVILATGYYDKPNLLGVPGEDQPHVFHYFKEAHPYAGYKCVVIGGKNSAADTALELQMAGADVTIVHRHSDIDESVKSWVRPLVVNAIKFGRISAEFQANVLEIGLDTITIEQNGKKRVIPADFVFAMIGYRPSLELLRKLGAEIDEEAEAPIYDEETMKTSVDGLYLAGVVASGRDSSKIFIENGRFHGEKIAKDLLRQKAERG